MPRKTINNLCDFTQETTFARLLDRAYQLEKLILTTTKLRALDVTLWNTLADNGISVFALIRDQSELFSTYYRSMFQASLWEPGTSGHIETSAYSFDTCQIDFHDKVIEHVDKTVAHQDVNDGDRRYVYTNIKNQSGDDASLVASMINYHVHDLEPNVIAMKSAIKLAFHKKFNYELQLLNREQ